MKNINYFKDKVIVITGASSGIGKELSLCLAHLGGKLVLAARDEARLIELKTRISSNENEVITQKTDVSIEEEIVNLINTTLARWGRLDIFISNAGQYVQKPIEDIIIEEYRDLFEVNFYGSLYAVKHILPIMIAQNTGHMVFINSLDAKKGVIGDAPYVATKSALDGFADVLRQEVKEFGIDVMSVYPGRVDTPMIQDIKVPSISKKISPEKVADAIIKGIYKHKPVIIVPKKYYLIGALNNLSPSLMDWLYKIFKIEGHKIK